MESAFSESPSAEYEKGMKELGGFLTSLGFVFLLLAALGAYTDPVHPVVCGLILAAVIAFASGSCARRMYFWANYLAVCIGALLVLPFIYAAGKQLLEDNVTHDLSETILGLVIGISIFYLSFGNYKHYQKCPSNSEHAIRRGG